MNGEVVSMFVIAQLANILINFIAGSWKTEQLDNVLANMSKNVNQMCFCALFISSSNTTLGKKCNILLILIFQVVQKHTMGEVKNYITIWLPVVSEIFSPKIIKIW